MPIVSVIVPAYNAEAYIEECILSVLRSTYSDLELIVVNDGSHDKTSEIVQKYCKQDTRVILIEQENAGVSAARNEGLDRAKGEWIMFVDADDLIPSNSIEVLLQTAKSHAADIVSGDHISFSFNDKDQLNNNQGLRKYSLSVWKNTEGLIKSLEDHPATYAVWGKLFRKVSIDNVRFVVERRVHEDSFFVFQCLLKCLTFVVIPNVVYRYRINSTSVTHGAFSDKYLDILYFTGEKEKIIVNEFPQLVEYLDNLVIKANMAILRNLCKSYDAEYTAIETACIKEVLERKKKFVPALKSDKRFFNIICARLYWLYKLLYYIRQKVR